MLFTGARNGSVFCKLQKCGDMFKRLLEGT